MDIERLMEYQRFAEDPELNRMIRETQHRYPTRGPELSDDEVSLVAAAGTGNPRGGEMAENPFEEAARLVEKKD